MRSLLTSKTSSLLKIILVVLIFAVVLLFLNLFEFHHEVNETTKVKIVQRLCAKDEANTQTLYMPRTMVRKEYEARERLIGGGCEQIWNKWLETTEAEIPKVPPKDVPIEFLDQYTLFGRIPLAYRYFNEKSVSKPVHWADFEAQLKMPLEKLWKKASYGESTKVVYEAMSEFKEYFADKKGAVIGSQRPWAEVYALRHGAASITTVDYQKTTSDLKERWEWIHPFDLAYNWTSFQQKWDFVISFSSIEHSGLGRYGDPLDPWGDLREMAKMHCLLKDKGLMILGLPLGDDQLVWNAHRIYGPIRLPWVMQGFKLLGVVTYLKDRRTELTAGIPWDIIKPHNEINSGRVQPAIVLQKI